MEIHKFIIFFLIFLFFVSPFVHSKTQCPASHCGNNNTTLPIKYPFRLQNQQTQKNCTYITNLTCTNQGLTILNLPNSGDFYVRHIDYKSSVVQLYDPENCLPKRLMTLNISSSYPLMLVYQLEYTFYKCPSGLIRIANLTSIGCMSNSSSAIVATHTVSSHVMKKLYRCNAIVTSYVPVSAFGSHDFIGSQSDFFLRWSENHPQEANRLVFEHIFYATRIMISIIAITMPPVLCIACCAHFGRMLRKNDATAQM